MEGPTRRTAPTGPALPLIVMTIAVGIVAFAVVYVVVSSREPAPDPASAMVVTRAPGAADPGTAPSPQPAPPAGSDRDGIEALAARIGASIVAGDAVAFADCYDLERMLAAVEGTGVLPSLRKADRRAAQSGMREALERSLNAQAGLDWDRFEIRRIQELPDRVALVHFRVPGPTAHVFHGAWWLNRRTGTWKIDDLEEHRTGARATLLLGAAGAARLEPSGWARTLPQLELALRRLRASEHGEAVAALEPLQSAGLPEPIEGLRRTFLAVARAALGDLDGAELEVAAAARLRGAVPALDLVRASLANRRGVAEEAMTAAKRYESEVGVSAESSLQLGLAQRALRRSGDAIESFRTGLAEEPGAMDLLIELALTLPSERLEELAAVFEEMPDPAAAFEPLVLDLLAAGANEAVVVLAEQQRVRRPGHERAPLLVAEAHLAAGRPAEAATLLREALPGATEAQRPVVQRRLADALMAAGQPVEAYAALPDPAAAFPIVADQLAATGDVSGLATLVDEVQARTPADPLLPYYTGLLAELQGRLDEAARIYVKALRGARDDAMRRKLHRATVSAMYRGGAMTKAYEVVPPRHETAELLAQLCAQDRDDRGLQRIFDAHTPRVPEDKAWRRWGAELSYLRGDYLAAKIAIDALRGACLEHKRLARWYDDRLVRSLIRLKRFDDALRAARDATERRDGDPLYEFLAYSAAGRVAEVLRVTRHLIDRGYAIEWLYDDEDSGPNLRNQPAFAPFRQAFRRHDDGPTAGVLAEQVWVDR